MFAYVLNFQSVYISLKGISHIPLVSKECRFVSISEQVLQIVQYLDISENWKKGPK